MAGGLPRTGLPGDCWQLCETARSLAVVYGLELRGGEWPPDVPADVRLHGSRVVADDPATIVPPGLPQALRQLQVESWEAVRPADGSAGAFRFRPLGTTHVVSLFPPMRYTRGLNREETELAVEIWRLSAVLVALPVESSGPLA